MPSSYDYGTALETLFRELNARWDASTSRPQIVTDERVLRELALPPQAQTRLCYFAVPTMLLSVHRELVFPLVEDAGLVPASGDELPGWEGSVRAAIDALLQRARVLIGDVGSDDTRVWSEIRSAAQRETRPHVALVAEPDQDLTSQMIPHASVFRRPSISATLVAEEDDVAASAWLDELGTWLQEIGTATVATLEDEALQLLEQGLYRPAVIASMSALEVALQDALERRYGWWDQKLVLRTKGPKSPLRRLLDAGAEHELIQPDEVTLLRELQRERNALVHTPATIHHARARRLVTRTVEIARRVRAV